MIPTFQPMDTAPKDGSRILTYYPLHGNVSVKVIHWADLSRDLAMWEAFTGKPVKDAPSPKWCCDDGTEFPNPAFWFPIPIFPPNPTEKRP